MTNNLWKSNPKLVQRDIHGVRYYARMFSSPVLQQMKDEGLTPVGISRRSFLKSVASLAAAVGFFPGSLLFGGCSGDSADGKYDPCGYLFQLTKGPLKDNGATPWYATLFLGTPGQTMTVMMDTGGEPRTPGLRRLSARLKRAPRSNTNTISPYRRLTTRCLEQPGNTTISVPGVSLSHYRVKTICASVIRPGEVLISGSSSYRRF